MPGDSSGWPTTGPPTAAFTSRGSRRSNCHKERAVTITEPFALSRTLDPSDYAELPYALAFVDRVHLDGHPPSRRWEYAVALEAIVRWCANHGKHTLRVPVYDVGGAESPFADLLLHLTGVQVAIIDPDGPVGTTRETYVEGGVPLAGIVPCLSVLPDVEDLDRFCYYLACLTAPGGLLVLTVPYTASCGDRGRFCPKSLAGLRQTFRVLQFETFGQVDHRWRGVNGARQPTVASLVLEKRV